MPFVTFNATQFHYRTSKRSPDDTPVLLCVHGSGATSLVWSYQVSRLSKYYRIIAPDLPCHGESGGTIQTSAAAYALWINQFINTLQLPSLYLCGHSFGGAIVQEYARTYSHNVRGLILVSTGCRFALSRAYYQMHTQNLDLDTAIARGIVPESFKQGYAFLKSVSSETLHADLLAAGVFDSSAWITDIHVPALVLWGTNDVITPREMSSELANSIPGAVFQEIPNAGHVVMTDAPNAFNESVRAFMTRCESSFWENPIHDKQPER